MTSRQFLHLVGVAHSRCCGLLGMALHELLPPEPVKPGTQPAAIHYFRNAA